MSQNMSQMIRLATIDDVPAIHAIYSPVVSETVISFEVEPPSLEQMRQRITKVLAAYPWLVYEEEGDVRGYAYASQHRERAAYQWSADVSVYVHEQWRGKRVGRALYTSLFGVLRTLGYVNVFAGVTLPNAASVALHEAMGMEPLGVYHHVGYKMGQWHDVGWWQGLLQPRPMHPEPPQPVGAMQVTPQWESLLALGLSLAARA